MLASTRPVIPHMGKGAGVTEDYDQNRAVDLEIVSASWRSLNEATSYDRLLASWDRKLAAAEERSANPLDDALFAQLTGISERLDDHLELRTQDEFAEAVGVSTAPAMVLSPEGRVVTFNQAARAFFGMEQGSMAGRAWLREDSRADFEAVFRAGAGRGNADYAIVRILGPEGRESLAEVAALHSRSRNRIYTVVRSLELDWSADVGQSLAKAFGLTAAEVDICRLVFRHSDLDRVASARNTQRETIRTQLKRIFAKTETRSQPELMRLLGLLCSRAESLRERSALGWSDPLGNETILRRIDGRRLAYTWTGAEEGEPVLFLHGELPYFVQHEHIRQRIAETGLKLICMSTPGHGHSDPPDGRHQLDDGCDAVIALCDHLGLRGIPGLASYSGQLYLTRTAARRPDLFRSLLCIGLPWNMPQGRWRKLTLNQRTFARIARLSPAVFELVCRIGFRLVQREGPDFYLHRSFGEAEIDRRIVMDPEFQPLLRIACRHLTSQGHSAFMREQLMVGTNDPTTWLSQVQVPLHWVIPAEAENVDAEDCAAARASSPRATLEVVEGAGELFPYQRPGFFLRLLEDLAAQDVAEIWQRRGRA